MSERKGVFSAIGGNDGGQNRYRKCSRSSVYETANTTGGV